jgi:hypothetical protein
LGSDNMNNRKGDAKNNIMIIRSIYKYYSIIECELDIAALNDNHCGILVQITLYL